MKISTHFFLFLFQIHENNFRICFGFCREKFKTSTKILKPQKSIPPPRPPPPVRPTISNPVPIKPINVQAVPIKKVIEKPSRPPPRATLPDSTDGTKPTRPPRPTRPKNREAVAQWWREVEQIKDTGFDENGEVMEWFHGMHFLFHFLGNWCLLQ